MTATRTQSTKPVNTALSTAPTNKTDDPAQPSAIDRIQNHQATQLTVQTFKTTADGFKAVWQMESENQFGRSVASFLKNIFVACLLPMLSLIWLGAVAAWNWAWNPETHAKVSAKWAALTAWLAPKFDYERDTTGA